MVWENGCTVIVMMTALLEDGEQQCERYWPDEGSSLYNIYEVKILTWLDLSWIMSIRHINMNYLRKKKNTFYNHSPEVGKLCSNSYLNYS